MPNIFDARTWYKDDVGPTGERKKPESNIKNNYVTLRRILKLSGNT
ncbi:hypothetical protein RDI58_004130 [Solanum bulbocastanum]|uniref:Uncharacterized protein n=1 Tax=Solanum bulbocastanum TaxID=147425 RepID=A0AAN8U133_SOLBU